jgi:ryanodine receptor 2
MCAFYLHYRLARFLETAGSVLNYFEPFLGRIEIMGSSKKIERVYFEIKESNIEQWEKPQIKESKRAFFYSIVTEGGDKEKLEAFVNFCEDAIFEMTHASEIMATDDKAGCVKREASYNTYISEEDEERAARDPIRRSVQAVKDGFKQVTFLLSPTNIKHQIGVLQTKSVPEIIVGFFKMIFYAFYYTGYGFYAILRYFFNILMNLMRGPAVEEEEMPLVAEVEQLPSLSLPPLPIEEAQSSVQAFGMELSKEESGQFKVAADSSETGQLKSEEANISESSPEELSTEGSDSEARVEPPMTLQDLLGGDAAKAAEKERREAQKVQEAAMATIEAENRKSSQATAEPAAVNQIDFSQYAHKAVSFLARNFYTLKYVALVLAFCINFMLLFYRVTTFGEEHEGSGDNDLSDIASSGSGSGAEGIDLGSGDGSGEAEEDDPMELVQVEEVYIEHAMRFAAAMHSLVSLCMLIAYYHLKVPLAIFKREKEIARRLEFDGLFIAEHPEDDDIKSHWDKLVISSKRYNRWIL